jgi:hypothetical protein
MIIRILMALKGLSLMVTTGDAETFKPHASKILSLSESSFRALTVTVTLGYCHYCHWHSIEGCGFGAGRIRNFIPDRTGPDRIRKWWSGWPDRTGSGSQRKIIYQNPKLIGYNWPLSSHYIVNFRICYQKKWYERNCSPWKWNFNFKNSILPA